MNIKFDTLRKFSMPLPRSRFLNSGLEGFESSEIVIRSKCDLHTFVSIASELDHRHSETSPTYMRLNPAPKSFINPSRATSSLSIDFSNCYQLLLAMSIRDFGDQRNASVKTSTRKGSGMLRLLGSKCVIKLQLNVSNQLSTEVDCIFPFYSHTILDYMQLNTLLHDGSSYEKKPTQPPTESSGHKRTVVFYRVREHYDPAQGRYLSPWKSISLPYDVADGDRTTAKPEIKPSNATESTFSMVWGRCTPPSTSFWTSDAIFSGFQVVGNVSTFFPCITFFGASTIREIETLLQPLLED